MVSGTWLPATGGIGCRESAETCGSCGATPSRSSPADRRACHGQAVEQPHPRCSRGCAARRDEIPAIAISEPALCRRWQAINAPDPDWPASLRGEAAEIYLRWNANCAPGGSVSRPACSNSRTAFRAISACSWRGEGSGVCPFRTAYPAVRISICRAYPHVDRSRPFGHRRGRPLVTGGARRLL